jgi:hypothetical protein
MNSEKEETVMRHSQKTFTLRFSAILLTFMLLLAAVTANAQSITERLQVMEDYVEIEQLLVRYAIAFNTGDADAYVGTFAPDGELQLLRQEGEAPFAGPFDRDGMRAQWFSDHPGPGSPRPEFRRFGGMRHVTTNPLIEVDGDTATVEAIFMEVISNGPNLPQGSNPPTIWAMGRYMDDLVKIDGKWYFQRRTVITDMNEKFEP